MNTFDLILTQNNINPGNTKHVLSYIELVNLLRQTVGQAVLATMSAPTQHLKTTTYDQQLVEATTYTIVDHIKNHFE
jgi:hypothetical protein